MHLFRNNALLAVQSALLASGLSLPLNGIDMGGQLLNQSARFLKPKNNKGRNNKSSKWRLNSKPNAYTPRPTKGAFIADTGWAPKPSQAGPQFNRAPKRRSWRIARKHLKKQGLLTR